MKIMWQDFINELSLYYLYIKETVEDFINPKPPTGMA